MNPKISYTQEFLIEKMIHNCGVKICRHQNNPHAIKFGEGDYCLVCEKRVG